MHVFTPHRDSLMRALKSPSPLITLSYTPQAYLLQLLSALIEEGQLKVVEIFEEGFGLSRLTKRGGLNKKTTPEREVSAYLTRYIEEIDLEELSGSGARCLCLALPAEVVERSDLEAALSALCTRLSRQRALSVLISVSSPLPERLSEWTRAVELTTPRRDEEGLIYLEQLLCEAHEALNGQSDRERRRVTERLMTRVQGLDASGLCVAVEEAHEQVMIADAPRDLTAWEEGMMRALLQVKTTRLRRSVGLELQPLEDFSSDDLAGMERYKRYLDYMSALFQHSEDRIRLKIAPPKGVLLVGLPGCGKSLAAKLTASRLNLPLLRLELDAIMGRYLGESEHNLIRALETAEAAAPCVLWIDELDKALSGLSGDGGSGTGQRLLGRLLTWMQEQIAGVYLFATANRVGHLPPELLRRGRFDELWKVMLPNEDERGAILKQKLRSRGQLWGDDSLSEGVRLTEGFTGADIEALVREALVRAFCAASDEVTLKVFKSTHAGFTPLSQQFEEVIKRETEALEKHGFRDVSGGDDLPPEVSLERRAMSSSELKRLCDVSNPLRFHFGDDPESGWTLQIETKAEGWVTSGWIDQNDKPISPQSVKLAEIDRGLSLSPPFIFGQERFERLTSEGGHLIGLSSSGLRMRETRRFELYVNTLNLQRSETIDGVRSNNQHDAGDLITKVIEGERFSFCYIPPGTFRMGTDDKDLIDSNPKHPIKITNAFWIGQTLISQKQWQVITGHKPKIFVGQDRSTVPMVQVSWLNCVWFCNQLSEKEGFDPVYTFSNHNSVKINLDCNGYRLPTEAEWEYAAKAGTDFIYAGSDNLQEVTYLIASIPHLARRKPNTWGLYDMSSITQEWCSDIWNPTAYQNRSTRSGNQPNNVNPHCISDNEWLERKRVTRSGGSLFGVNGVAYRDSKSEGYHSKSIGFRILRCENFNAN